MEDIKENIIKKVSNKKSFKQSCECCKFTANTPTEWLKHVVTKKHLRNGTLLNKDLKCEICNIKSTNIFNFKVHQIIVHGTPEDRKTKCKFYCECCDVGFFCKLYYDKHNESKKHSNMIKVKETLIKLD